MLNSFSTDWNGLFKTHPSLYSKDSVTIIEKGATAKNKKMTVNCTEVVSFPSKQFDGYDMFSALTNRNSDGAFLFLNEFRTYDLVFIEMKSRFSTQEVFEAKCQIVETYAKLQSLFQMMKAYKSLPIQRIYGVIETQELDADQMVWWSKQQMLPEKDMQFGERLLKCSFIEAPTRCSNTLNMPDKMTFRILLSNDADYTIDYSDLCNSL
jgi:hypothetical protein